MVIWQSFCHLDSNSTRLHKSGWVTFIQLIKFGNVGNETILYIDFLLIYPALT